MTQDRVVVVGVFKPGKKDHEIRQLLQEMVQLTKTAGGEVSAVVRQHRPSPDMKFYVGSGKLQDIRSAINEHQADLVIFFNSLSGIQQRNLEGALNVRVIDRSRLILDIFAGRARSLEGKLQVELAQLLYLLPRLTGKGIELSRLGGGIGTRGPGETRLETDRRVINKRISVIKKKLAHVIKHRDAQRKQRRHFPVPIVSLVGYTSAGKSTVFSGLTSESVTISRNLFSTLDPLLRRVDLFDIEPGYYFLLSDTVGFIREMPRELFESFKATLEEMIQADLLLHVVDVSNPDHMEQRREVEKILAEMNISPERIVVVNNKIDLLPPGNQFSLHDPHGHPAEVFVSARTGLGLDQLRRIVYELYFSDYEHHTVEFPTNAFNLDSFQRWAIVLKKTDRNGRTVLEILCSRKNMIQFSQKYGGFLK